MKKVSRTLVLLLMVLVTNIATAQSGFKPKPIKSKKPYKYSNTKVKFPTSIGNFERAEMHQYDKKKENIGSRYLFKNKKGRSILSVYIYPAGAVTDVRFREDYGAALQAMRNAVSNNIPVNSTAVRYKNDGYTINGYQAVLQSQRGVISLLQVYECSNWFFKIRISSNQLDSSEVSLLVQEVLKEFNPVELVKSKPLSSKTAITLSPELKEDTVFMEGVINSAVSKIKWAEAYVNPEENAAGFPSLYLYMHTLAIEKLVKFVDSSDAPIGELGEDYVRQYKLLIDAGFLEEYVMEKYDRIMMIPRDVVLDYAGYDKWKKSNNITLDDKKRLYYISYETAGKKNKKR